MRFFRAAVIYALGNIVAAAVPFALLPLLTRVLTPAEYGHVVAFSLMVMLCMPFAGLSVAGAVGIAWFNRTRADLPAFVGAALVIALSSTALTAIVVGIFMATAPGFALLSSPVWGALAAVTAGMNCILQCRLSLWQSQHQPIANAALQVAASILNVGLSLFFVFALQWGGDGRNTGIALSACLVGVAAIGLLVSSNEAAWEIRRADVRTLLSYGAPLIPHVFGGVLIGTADRWIVSVQLGPEQLGIYGAGAQLGMVMTVLADAFAKVYGPWLYARLTSENPNDKYAAVGAIYVAAPVFLAAAAAVCCVLYLASSFLLGPQYRAATVVLPWFVLGGAFTGIYYCTTNLFFFSGRTSLLSLTTTCSAAAGTLAIWILASTFGIEGAAMGYAVTQAMLALAVNIVASQTFDLPWRGWRKAIACLMAK
jgi:O-antigen/teichoic acid export membrane protein